MLYIYIYYIYNIYAYIIYMYILYKPGSHNHTRLKIPFLLQRHLTHTPSPVLKCYKQNFLEQHFLALFFLDPAVPFEDNAEQPVSAYTKAQ